MNRKIKNKGFTLIETLVAISILSLSIAATFTAVQNGIRSSTYAKDQITAFYLAQEGMEFIRNVRDENALHAINGTPTDWLAGLATLSTDPCFFGNTCRIDSFKGIHNPGGVVRCAGVDPQDTCLKLNQNSVSGLYGYTSGANWVTTNFRRSVIFSPFSADEVRVTIIIEWTTKGTDKSFTVTESLFNH